MKCIGIYPLIVITLFYFSEGKPCPEKTRPHKTRCEVYYKCMELQSKSYVWVPEKCEQGLVYEHTLGLCVLPGDDWECTLGDTQVESESNPQQNEVTFSNNLRPKDNQLRHKPTPKDQLDVYIVSSKEADDGEIIDVAQAPAGQQSQTAVNLDNSVELVLDGDLSSEEDWAQDENQYESSGDGAVLTGFLPAENSEAADKIPMQNRETEDEMPVDEMQDGKMPVELEIPAEHKETKDEIPMKYREEKVPTKIRVAQDKLPKPEVKEVSETAASKIDPKLTAHLQRLTQLIDGLKQTYQSKDQEQTELRPDQLNAFLAHFNIKNKFDSLGTTKTDNIDSAGPRPMADTSGNKTQLSSKLQPETKGSGSSSRLPSYQNQIMVNRPEGSILFTLPSAYSSESQFTSQGTDYTQNTPKISEETLQRVLELSKQMIANQNIPKVIPNPGFYGQPVYQQLFLPPPPPAFGGNESPFSSYYGNNNNQATNSGEKEVVDSYGQSLGAYPPLQAGENGNSNNGYQLQTINHMHTHSHRYENNKFVTSVTTMRPLLSTTPSNQYVGQYPSSYATDVSLTTARPPFEYPPSPSTIAQFYTPSPHLNENNVNSLFSNNERYPTVQYGNMPRPMELGRPSSNIYQQVERPNQQSSYLNSLFPGQIDPSKVNIRPNAQKIESMEVEAEDYGNNYDDRSPQQSVLTYSSNNDRVDIGNQLTGSYSGSKNPYMPRPPSTGYGATLSIGGNKPKYPTYGSQSQQQSQQHGYPDGTQLVNVGGSFVNLEVFQNSLRPLLGGATINELANVEVITCATGVRQPNSTDCTRYYVCSKKDGKVLSYSCPPYTAFNGQTRICDARTYAQCSPEAIVSSYTVTENKRIQLEAIQAAQEAKRRREQAIKNQAIANLLHQYSGQFTSAGEQQGDSGEKDMLNTYVQQAASMSVVSSTPRPIKKRKYYCREGDKIPDQTSIYSYFVCYKNAQGMMKGHKMTCSKGLLFCPKTTMCTLASKCVG